MDQQHSNNPDHIAVETVSMSVTLPGKIKLPFLLAPPEPIVGTSPQEYQSKLWLFGNGGKGSVGIPILFSALTSDTEAYKTSRSQRDKLALKVFRMICWTLVTFAIFGILPFFQISYLKWMSGFRYQGGYFPNADLKPLFSPIWNKKATIQSTYMRHTDVAVFSKMPTSHIARPFNRTLKTYHTTGIILEQQDVFFNITKKPISGPSGKAMWTLSVYSPDSHDYTFFNLTDYLDVRNITSFHHKVPLADLGKKLQFTVSSNCFFDSTECKQDLEMEVSGVALEWNTHEAVKICTTDRSCTIDLDLFSNYYVYEMTPSTDQLWYSIIYEGRILTYVIGYTIVSLFFAALLHALVSLWFWNITLWDRVMGLFGRRKAYEALPSGTGDEEQPLLG
ncbi:hypothetical protein HDU97_010092 [Phlyctochytrium planicorne]|nr:hypothetical protein HDU97_010092 [Phlyctochytrium planicorne]